MNEDIKKLLIESTNKLLNEETINKMVEINEKFVEKQLFEAAEKFIIKENEINEKYETLKENFVNWLDVIAEDITEKESKKQGISEINEDVVKFYKMINEMSKKYKNEDDDTEEDDDEEEKEPKKNNMKSKKSKKEEDDEDEEDDEKDELKESISQLIVEKNKLIIAGIIAEKITHNDKLSEKQKDDLTEICESAEFDGVVDSYIKFVNQEVEIALAGNDTISNSGLSTDPTIKESIILEEVEKIVEPVKKVNKANNLKFRESKSNSDFKMNVKGVSGELV